MHFVARAVTPPRRKRRYDTRFFTADASTIAHRIDGKVGADVELVELVWLPLSEVKQRIELMAITEIVLRELNAQLEEGFSHDLPVPYFHVVHGTAGARSAVMPQNDGGTRVSLTFAARTLVSAPTAVNLRGFVMAKAVTTKIKLISSADTGFYYVTKKNSRTMTEKLKMKKYDPIAKKHVEFVEGKIK